MKTTVRNIFVIKIKLSISIQSFSNNFTH